MPDAVKGGERYPDKKEEAFQRLVTEERRTQYHDQTVPELPMRAGDRPVLPIRAPLTARFSAGVRRLPSRARWPSIIGNV